MRKCVLTGRQLLRSRRSAKMALNLQPDVRRGYWKLPACDNLARRRNQQQRRCRGSSSFAQSRSIGNIGTYARIDVPIRPPLLEFLQAYGMRRHHDAVQPPVCKLMHHALDQDELAVRHVCFRISWWCEYSPQRPMTGEPVRIDR